MYQELKYKGHVGMWSWILHRVTGVGIFFFLLAHIVDTAFLGWGPELYNKAVAFYHLPVMRVGEVILGACILFHALNGIRIIIIDFWEEATVYHRQLFWIEIVIFFILFIPSAYIMLRPIWE
jgi:succinate dehydrogenase / fumarate reductase cytochrome b subunit